MSEPIEPIKKRVLFLCTGNSCRSQMAEGLLRQIAGNEFEATSAGTNPTSVSPIAIRVMAEIAIDISGQRSKPVDELMGKRFDFVITLCDHAREACPVFPGAGKLLHWGLEDPAGATGSEEERLSVFRRVRDRIAAHTTDFSNDEYHKRRAS